MYVYVIYAYIYLFMEYVSLRSFKYIRDPRVSEYK